MESSVSPPIRRRMRLRSSGSCSEDYPNIDHLKKSAMQNLNGQQKTIKRTPRTTRASIHKNKLQKNGEMDEINHGEEGSDMDINDTKSRNTIVIDDNNDFKKLSKDLKSSKGRQNTGRRNAIKNNKTNLTQVTEEESSKENDNLSNKVTDEIESEEEQMKSKATKYQNARSVLNGCLIDKLPGRDKQLAELKSILKEHIESGRSGSLYVSGQPGTGKTACLSLILRDNDLRNRVQSAYINCTEISSTMAIYKKIYNELNIAKYYEKDNHHQRLTTYRDYMKALQDYLHSKAKTRKNKMLLLVFDEIDHLCSSSQSVLYSIFEWPSLNGAHLLLIGIANSLDLTERILKRLNVRTDIKPLHIHFPPYNKQEILDIFWTRLKDANVLDVFNPVTLQLLAAKVSAISGDVRRALNIGRRTIEIAEQQCKLNNQKLLEETIKNIDAKIDISKKTETDTNHTEGKELIVIKLITGM